MPCQPRISAPPNLGEGDPCWNCEKQHPFLLASPQEVKIDKNLEPGLRVTVQLNKQQLPGIKSCLSLRVQAASLLLTPSSQPFHFSFRKQDLPWESCVIAGPSHQSWHLLGLHSPTGLLPQ